MLKLQFQTKDILVHLLLFLVVYVAPNGLLLLPFYAVTQIYFLSKKKYNLFLIGGIYAVCLKSDLIYYTYSFIVIGAIFSLSKSYETFPFKKIRRYLGLFLAYITLTYILQLFYNYSPLSFPLFFITFLLPIGTFLFIGMLPAKQISFSYILNNLLYIAIVQVVITFFLQAVPTGISSILRRQTLGDRLFGTTNDATALSLLLLVGILPFLLNFFNKSNTFTDKRNMIAIAGVFVIMMFLNDSKTNLYAFILVFGAWYLLNNYFFGKGIATKVFFVLCVISVTVLSAKIIESTLGKISYTYYDYLYGRYNAKTVFYERTFSTKTRPIYQYVLGTGPGTNGTRASNALAYDVMYKKENTVKLPGFIPPASSDFTKYHLSNLYTERYANTSNYRSASLSSPFNSVCAIFLEFGIIGTFLFGLFLYVLANQNLTYGNPILAKAAFFMLLVNISISFLDQVFETPMPMHLMYLLFGLSLKTVSNQKKL